MADEAGVAEPKREGPRMTMDWLMGFAILVLGPRR